MFALCAFSPAIFNDGDTFSHIATGEWMARISPFRTPTR